MKKIALLLTTVVLASAGGAFGQGNTLPPQPAYPQGNYPVQPQYQPAPAYAQPPVAYAPAPVAYASPPVVYYTPPPVVYYAPAPVAYAPAYGGYGEYGYPGAYGGYGCNPLFGAVNLMFNYGGDDIRSSSVCFCFDIVFLHDSVSSWGNALSSFPPVNARVAQSRARRIAPDIQLRMNI